MKLHELITEAEEEWRKVPNWPYEVSSYGRVRNMDGRMLRPQLHLGRGGVKYFRVKLRKNGQSVNARVHRLVAMAFKRNRDHKPEVDHRDQNSLNNNAFNLRWATRSENERAKRKAQREAA